MCARFSGFGFGVSKLYNGLFARPPAVGIDIGSHSIKVVVLNKKDGGADFSAKAAEVALNPDCLKNKKIEDFDSVCSGLSFLREDLDIKGAIAAVSISGGAVFTSLMEVPPSAAGSKKLIEEAVSLHLESFFPEGTDDYYSDFHPRAAQTEKIAVAVAKKDAVDICVSALSRSGFTPAVVDYDGFAVINAYNSLEKNKPAAEEGLTVLLNVGRSVTNFAVLENSKTVLTRDLSRSSDELTLGIARAGDLTIDEAESEKTSLCAGSRTEFLSIAREFSTKVAFEVKSNLEMFLNMETQKTHKAVLSGGGSLLYGFSDVIAEILKVDVEYSDPIGDVCDGVDADYLKDLSPKTAVAFGLALRVL